METDVADLRVDERLHAQVGALLAALDSITAKSRWALGDAGTTDEALSWQPFPNGHSIGALLLHTADSEAYWTTQVLAGRMRDPEELRLLMSEETHQFDLHWPAPPAAPLAWFYEQQDRIRARTREIVAELADPLHVAADEDGQRYTLRFLLPHIGWHESYHGGQAVLLAALLSRYRHRSILRAPGRVLPPRPSLA